jgi:DNA polymerase III, alpha subunit (gram-positive type)
MARLSSRPYKEEVDKVMDLLVKGWQIIFYDVETTGLKSKTSKILSLSAIKYKYEDSLFKEVDRLNVFINPCLPIPEEASKVNGITNEKVKDEMDEWDTHEKIIRPFFGDNPILAGYNILKFDDLFMQLLWLRSCGVELKPEAELDVLRMVQEKMNLKSSTLENAAKELGADFGLSFHTSIDDVIATERVAELLLPMYYDADEPAKFRFKVYGCHYQYYSHKNERIYVHTYPKSSTYYDVYAKSWHSDCLEGFNLKDLQTDVLRFMGVKDEKELVKLEREKWEENSSENIGG